MALGDIEGPIFDLIWSPCDLMGPLKDIILPPGYLIEPPSGMIVPPGNHLRANEVTKKTDKVTLEPFRGQMR